MIDRLIHEYLSATDDERAAFHKTVAQAGVSAEELIKAANTLSEIARKINNKETTMAEKKEETNVQKPVSDAATVFKNLGNAMRRMCEAAAGESIKLLVPVAYLYCPYLRVEISVYEPVGWFKRLMLRWCFGLEYRKIEEKEE